MASSASPVRHAFTLLELLIVVAILGLLAGVVVMATEKVQQNAQRTREMSNQEDIRRAMGVYYAANDSKWPDGWDTGLSAAAYTYSDASVGVAAVKDTTRAGTVLTGADAYPLIYRGDPQYLDTDGNQINQGVYGQLHGRKGATGHTSDANAGAGIYDQWRKCTVFYLNNAEGFNRAPCKLAYNSTNTYTQPDTTVGVRNPNDHTNGSTAFALATGVPVMIIDRSTRIGAQMYRDLGQNPEVSYNIDEAGKEKAFTLVLLGLGTHNKLIGCKLGGFDRCPESSGTGAAFINHYWVVWKVYTNKGADQDAQVVGVLDGRGDTVSRQDRLNKGTDPIAN